MFYSWCFYLFILFILPQDLRAPLANCRETNTWSVSGWIYNEGPKVQQQTIIQGVPENIAQSVSTTILQPCTTELCHFWQNVQKEKCLHDKGQCLNNAIKYSLLFSWPVKYLKTKQSTSWHITFCFHICIYAIVLAVRKRLHSKNKNLFIQEPSMTDLALNYTFLQTLACIQSFQFVCCFQGLNFTASKHFELQIILGNFHNWRMWNSSLSLVISRGLLLLSLVVFLGWQLKMIGKGFVLFKINSSPSAFYIIKPTCIVIGF